MTEYNPFSLVDVLMDGQETTARPYEFDSEPVNSAMQNAEGVMVRPTKLSTICPSCGQGVDIIVSLPEPPFPVIEWSCVNCNPEWEPPQDVFMNPLEEGRIEEHELDPLLQDPDESIDLGDGSTVADRLKGSGTNENPENPDEKKTDDSELDPDAEKKEVGEDGEPKEPKKDEPEGEKSDNEESKSEEIKDEVVEEVKSEEVNEEPKEEVIKDEEVKDEEVKGEVVKDEVVKDEEAKDEPKKKPKKKKKTAKKAPKKDEAKASDDGEEVTEKPEESPLTVTKPKSNVEAADGMSPEEDDD